MSAAPLARPGLPGLNGEDFAAIFKSPQRARSAHFSLHWRPGTAAGSRLGLVVAKRLTRTGVRRNLIKRQARALFAQNLRQAAAVLPRDVVLRLTRNSVALKRVPQYAELAGLFAALARDPGVRPAETAAGAEVAASPEAAS